MKTIKDLIGKVKTEIKGRTTLKKRVTEHYGSLCTDNLSGFYQPEYTIPKVILEFSKNGEKFMRDRIKGMKPDMFNESFLDRHIEDLIELAKDDIVLQRRGHERTISDIRVAQMSRIRMFQDELATTEREIAKIREEIAL